MARIGLLTGGGDCPGLNAVIRAVVRRGLADAATHVRRLPLRLGGRAARRRDRADAAEHGRDPPPRRHDPRHLAHQPLRRRRRRHRRRSSARSPRRGVDALIPIGGEDTLGVALRLHDDGVPIVGVPKTIDNDLGGTDVTFGFQTAVQIVTDAIDRLHTTAESHDRVMVVEVMGRHAGWIATHAGLAGGADAILVPERPFDIDDVVAHLRAATSAGAASRSWSSPRAPRRARARCRSATAPAPTPSATRASAASASMLEERDRAPHRLRDARDDPRPRAARRHAGRLRPRARARASAWRRSTPPRPGASADGRRCAAPRSSRSRSRRRCASRSCSTPALYETAELFFG